ncbi:MAG: glycosyltransferase [Fimbriimonadaceae bacterium]
MSTAWLRGKPDWFFVPQEYSRDILAQRLPGVKDKITVTGIPVHPVFESAPKKRRQRAQLGIDETADLALVSSGGIGGGPLLEAVEALRIQGLLVTVISGRNEAMRAALKNRFQDDPRVNVLGHIDQATMVKHMAAADFLVAKPGGLTTFEALTVGLPFLVYWPFLIPGQEEGNADFLEQCGAGVIARGIKELEQQAIKLKNPELRAKMSEAAKAHAPHHSAEKIVQQIIALSSQE